VSVGEYNNTRVKVAVNYALKYIMSESVTIMQKANQKKDKREIRALEKYKEFDDWDRTYWLEHYNVEITNSDVFTQIQRLNDDQTKENPDFYWSPDMRRIVSVIIASHFTTYRPNDLGVSRYEQSWVINYIVYKNKEYEVIGITKMTVLDAEKKESVSEYRIYENDVLQTMFTSEYFKAMYFKPYEDL
jgi:hypothetical protein